MSVLTPLCFICLLAIKILFAKAVFLPTRFCVTTNSCNSRVILILNLLTQQVLDWFKTFGGRSQWRHTNLHAPKQYFTPVIQKELGDGVAV
jgi:hypothetical protein